MRFLELVKAKKETLAALPFPPDDFLLVTASLAGMAEFIHGLGFNPRRASSKKVARDSLVLLAAAAWRAAEGLSLCDPASAPERGGVT